MAKQPPNTPAKGDRCRKRGATGQLGVVVKVDAPDDQKNWCQVLWDDVETPQMCHLFELEAVGGSRLMANTPAKRFLRRR